MRPSSAASTRCVSRRSTASTRCSSSPAAPAGPSTSGATASRSARRPPSRSSSGAPDSLDGDAILLLGVGESSDAYHMSSPHPEGRGAQAAMLPGARERRPRSAQDIDYINLHGTGTPSNDSAEGQAVAAVFGEREAGRRGELHQGRDGSYARRGGSARGRDLRAVRCSTGLLPGSAHTRQVDPSLGFEYLCANRHRPIAPRAQQLVWIRRHQLLPRAGARAMSRSACEAADADGLHPGYRPHRTGSLRLEQRCSHHRR